MKCRSRQLIGLAVEAIAFDRLPDLTDAQLCDAGRWRAFELGVVLNHRNDMPVACDDVDAVVARLDPDSVQRDAPIPSKLEDALADSLSPLGAGIGCGAGNAKQLDAVDDHRRGIDGRRRVDVTLLLLCGAGVAQPEQTQKGCDRSAAVWRNIRSSLCSWPVTARCIGTRRGMSTCQ